MTMPDMFGEKHIFIKGDKYLNGIANHILELIGYNPELLEGDTMGAINRKIHLAIMLDSGLAKILTGENVKENFVKWYVSKEYPTEEETARAVRAMCADDLIRLPKKLLIRNEQHRVRIEESLR